MPYVRTLTGWTPPARTDGLPFTSAIVQESSSAGGPFTAIETFALSPLDVNPANPATRSFTTTQAQLDPNAWYRIVWQDAAAAQFIDDPVYWPTGSALCTLAQVREFMQKKAIDTGQDALLLAQINRISRAIMNWTEREFAPASSGVTRSFRINPGLNGFVELAPYDLRLATAITVTSDNGAAPLTLAQFTEWEYGLLTTDGTYTELMIDIYKTSTRRFWPTLTITGDWGFTTVPDDVVQAAIVATVDSMRTDVAAYSVVNEAGGETRFERGSALPAKAKELLMPYRRCVLV